MKDELPLPGWREQLIASTTARFPGARLEHVTVLMLLLLALVLRCWGLPNIPYTHDEISALVRVDHATLGLAIEKGVENVDTHPPGTHAFLWAWTQLFGFGDGVVKLPFILMSVLAIFFHYRFTHALAGSAVALTITALLCCLQYTVMYGQIARPYAMGFFSTALLADQLVRFIGHGRVRNAAGFAIAAVLSAYTHHFALLLATLMVVTGFMLLEKPQRKTYSIASGLAALAYVPNLSLFFAQLGWKGLDEWLTAPGPGWVLDYTWWIAHCSAPMAGLLLLLIGLSIYLRVAKGRASTPSWMVAIAWGLLPLAVGYGYSVWRAPVLQYSVLLFSFPFLLLGLLSGLRYLAPLHGTITAGLLSIVGVATLIVDRQHFALFGVSKYEDIVRGTLEAEEEGLLAVVDLPPEVMTFYRKLWCINPSQAPHINLRTLPPNALDSLLARTEAKGIFYGQTTHAEAENVAKVQARFPFLIRRKDRMEGQTFVFRARPVADRIEDDELKALRTPQAIGNEQWHIDTAVRLASDSSNAPFLSVTYWDLQGLEYGALFERDLDSLEHMANDVIEIRADVERASPATDLRIIAELRDGDSTHFYRAGELRRLPEPSGRNALQVAVKLADLPRHGAGLTLRTYLYNPSKERAWIGALSVHVRQGNPVLYGAFDPIRGPWQYR